MAGLEILKGLEISTASRSFGAVTSALEERKKKITLHFHANQY